MYFDKYLRGVIYAHIARFLFLPFTKRRSNRVIIVSHRLAGNAKSFADWLLANHPELDIAFATDDPDYYRSVRGRSDAKIRIISLQRFFDWFYIAPSSVILTTHGPTFFYTWQKAKRRPVFFELWHGVGFKGRDKLHVRSLDFYKALFVSSPYFKKLHENWGFNDGKLKVTGYSRTDQFINLKLNTKEKTSLLKKFDLENSKGKIILIAVTWKSNKSSKGLLVDDEDTKDSIEQLEQFANKSKNTIIVRAHLNSSLKSQHKESSNLKFIPFTSYPDTEDLLKITDILVTDWSSIYTDFLPLQRPVIFIDNQPDFDGSSLTDSDRAGPVVGSTKELVRILDSFLEDKGLYMKKYKSAIKSATDKAWGQTLDGKSSERYYNNLKEYIR